MDNAPQHTLFGGDAKRCNFVVVHDPQRLGREGSLADRAGTTSGDLTGGFLHQTIKVPAQVAVGDDAVQFAVLGQGDNAESLGRHLHQRIAHSGLFVHERQLVAFVHQGRDRQKLRAKAATGVEG